MSKNPRSPLDTSCSRLEEPPLPRRDFLGLAGLWSAAVAMVFAFGGLLRLPKTALLPSPSRKFRIKPPSTFLPLEPYVPPGRNVAFYRDGTSAWAISLVCTHLGCIVRARSDGFACPCHGSVFAKDGAVVSGPAPKGLAWFTVRAADKGSFVIDEAEVVPPGTRIALADGKGAEKKI